MNSWNNHHLCEGPLGFPMIDRQARNLETILKNLPKSKEYEHKRVTITKATTELSQGERSDVSWISTETPDRYSEVVMAKGMNNSQFILNPIVTLNHRYYMPPIGRSLWQKVTKDGDIRGIKAKTVYPPKPETWTDPWPPDQVLSLIQAQLLNGKSIGFLPTKTHYAEAKEQVKNNWPDNTLVIDEWILVEYAVGSVPVNPEAVVEIVSKAAPSPDFIKALGWDEKLFKLPPKKDAAGERVVKFTTLREIESSLQREVGKINLNTLVQEIIEQKKGRV